jgi:uncharacterized damage-inducible protein DinB
MDMNATSSLLRRRTEAADRLYRDLIAELTPDLLRSRLPGSRSSPVGNHFWCVVGARESYVRAARAGTWQGFTSSLAVDDDPEAIGAALERSARGVAQWIDDLDTEDEASLEWAFHLLEHETQHHGQLIRYLYAVPLPMPRSWIEQYALEEV